MLNLKHRLNKVEHNFANIQTAYGFLWTLVSNLNAEQTKMNMETVIILIWRVVVKEEIIWKILTLHEITDDITEQIVSVIIQVCKELKCGFIRTYGGQVSLLLIHLSSITFVL